MTNTPQFTEEDVFQPVKLYINKTDAGTSHSIPMSETNKAVFEVCRGSTLLGTTTYREGRIEFEFTEAGQYTLKEIAAPDGYDASKSKTYTVTVKKGEITKVSLGGNAFTRFWNLILGLAEDYDAETATLTIPNEPQKTEFVGKKTWKDAAFFETVPGYQRPESVTIRLLADGKTIASQEVSAVNDWMYRFESLPTHQDGKAIRYEVEEVSVPGYASGKNGSNLENTPIVVTNLAPKALTIRKVDQRTGEPLKGGIFSVKKEGEAAETICEATGGDGKTTFQFTEPGIYTIREKRAPEGYLLNERSFTVEVTEGDAIRMERKGNVFHKVVDLVLTSNDLQDDVLTVEDVSFGSVTVRKEIVNYMDSFARDVFMIRVRALSGEEMETSMVLKSGEGSGEILVHETTTFLVEEILPAAYSLKEMRLSGDRNESLTGGRITVYPGENLVIHVSNRYGWKPYFYGSDGRMNRFMGSSL